MARAGFFTSHGSVAPNCHRLPGRCSTGCAAAQASAPYRFHLEGGVVTVRTGGARTGAATVLTHVNHRGPSRHPPGSRPALARWRLETGCGRAVHIPETGPVTW